MASNVGVTETQTRLWELTMFCLSMKIWGSFLWEEKRRNGYIVDSRIKKKKRMKEQSYKMEEKKQERARKMDNKNERNEKLMTE